MYLNKFVVCSNITPFPPSSFSTPMVSPFSTLSIVRPSVLASIQLCKIRCLRFSSYLLYLILKVFGDFLTFNYIPDTLKFWECFHSRLSSNFIKVSHGVKKRWNEFLFLIQINICNQTLVEIYRSFCFIGFEEVINMISNLGLTSLFVCLSRTHTDICLGPCKKFKKQ